MVSKVFRRYIPLLIIWICLIVFVVNYFTGEGAAISTELKLWQSYTIDFTILTGMVAFILRHVHDIGVKYREGDMVEVGLKAWWFVIFGLHWVVWAATSRFSPEYTWLSQAIIIPAGMLGAGMGGLYVVPSIFKAWRVRSWDTLVLAGSFLLVAIMRTPLFAALAPITMEPGNWATFVIQLGPMRVLQIGVVVGALQLFVRILRGQIRGYE